MTAKTHPAKITVTAVGEFGVRPHTLSDGSLSYDVVFDSDGRITGIAAFVDARKAREVSNALNSVIESAVQ
jgi:hypothetical protein